MEINERALRTRRREIRRQLGDELRGFRLDAGFTQSFVAHEAGVSQGHLSELESGDAEASVEMLLRLGAVLGLDPSIKLFANTGPIVRDRHQVAMTEGLLKALSSRWHVTPEVRVYRPVRGVIDVVLEDRRGPDSLAGELQSQLRRVEQQIRWQGEKADALAELPGQERRGVRQLLVLRSSMAVREAVRGASALLAAAYPGECAAAVAALTGTAPFPGSAIVWMTIEHGVATLLDGPPRGIAVGRSAPR